MTLREWQESSGRTAAENAAACGVHRTRYYVYLRGDAMPRPDVIARIEAMTEGKVGAADLYDATRRGAPL